MAQPDRHYLGDGVAIQLGGEVWGLDVYHAGNRFRRSLGTRSNVEAFTMASFWQSPSERGQAGHQVN